MKYALTLFAFLAASPALAEGYSRPIPQAQSATAEFWYALACIVLIAAMYGVHRMVMRK